MSKISRDELYQLIPAYVLDALDDDERSQVEALLVDDARAQAIEQDFREVSAVLPLTVPARQVDADLKNRLLQRIHEQDTSTEDAQIIGFPPKQKEKSKNSSRRMLILPFVAVVTLAVIGLVFVISTLDNAQSRQPQAIFRNLYEQPDSERIYVEASDETPTNGSLLISNDGQQAVLRVQNLPILDPEQAFQLWLVDDSGVEDGGVYQADDNAEVYILLPTDRPITEYVRLGMSIEPATGSPLGNAPTGPRVFGVNLR